MREIPMNCGNEFDAFTMLRHYHYWKPGERRAIKRGYSRRCRRLARLAIRLGDWE